MEASSSSGIRVTGESGEGRRVVGAERVEEGTLTGYSTMMFAGSGGPGALCVSICGSCAQWSWHASLSWMVRE